MNGVPMDAPRSERRKESERKPMIDLDAMDQAAELEHEIFSHPSFFSAAICKAGFCPRS